MPSFPCAFFAVSTCTSDTMENKIFRYSLVIFLILQYVIVLFSLPMFVFLKSVYLYKKHSPSQPERGRGAVVF